MNKIRFQFSDRRIALLLAILVLMIFSPALFNGFVDWDDPVYLLGTPSIQTLITANVSAFFTTFVSGNYHPLTMLGYALQYALFGLEPWGFHLVSLLLHALNAALAYLLLRRLGFIRPAAGIAILFFALHPLRVEAVAWVSAQKDLWSCFFVLLSLLAYMRAQQEEMPCGRYYLLALGAFLLALLFKGTALILPLLLIVVDLLMNKQFSRRLMLQKVPFFALSILFGVVAVYARQSFAGMLEESAGPLQLLFTAIYRLIGTFLLRSLYPWMERFPIAPPSLTGSLPPEVWLTCAGLLTLIIAGMLCWRQARVEVLGLVWFVVGLSTTFHLQTLGYSADRFTYLPALGLAITLGALVQRWSAAQPGPLYRKTMSGLLLGLLLLLGTATVRQIRVWHDSTAMLSSFVELYQKNSDRAEILSSALETRGKIRQEAGDEAGAQLDYAAALAAEPARTTNLMLAVEQLMGNGNFAAAEIVLNRVLALDGKLARAYVGRAMVYQGMQRQREARIDLQHALELDPNDAVAYNLLGMILRESGDRLGALQDFTRAIELASDGDIPYFNRGLLEIEMGQLAEAQRDFEAALQRNPANEGAREELHRLRRE